MKTDEQLFERTCGTYDHKHINNTSNKPMPVELIEKINNGEVTIEVLDEFQKRGYDIYKYATQLTIHGTFDDELQRRVNGYVCMTVNKNGSLGVRWIAIDVEKKRKIFSYLKEVGYVSESNSQEYYAYKLKKISSKNDPAIAELKAESEKINKDLFFGSCGVRIVRDLWNAYAQLYLCVNAIYENNVDKLIENVSGKTMSELERIRNKRLADERERWEKSEREWAEKRKKNEEESKAIMERLGLEREKIIQDLLSNGYERRKASTIKKGNVVRVVYIAGSTYTPSSLRIENEDCTVTKVDKDGTIHTRDKSFHSYTIRNRRELLVKVEE